MSGQLPIRVPGPAHGKDPMHNRWCNDVRECLLRLSNRDSAPPLARLARGGGMRPFQPYGLRDDSGTWKVKINKGVLQDIHVLNEGGGGSSATTNPPIIPTINTGGSDDPIFTDDPVSNPSYAVPELSLPGFESYIYLKYTTDDHGNLKYGGTDKVEIVAEATEQDSVHWKPPDGDGNNGEDGEVYLQIAKTISNGQSGADEKPVLVHIGHQSNVFIDHFPGLRNLGAGSFVYKEYDADTDFFDLRSVQGAYGIGDTQGANEIEIEFDAENIGTAVSAGDEAEVYVEPSSPAQDDKAQFRRLTQGPSGRQQIEINETAGATGEVIQIMGNDVDGTLEFSEDASDTVVQVEDGLVKVIYDGPLPVRTYDVCEGSGSGKTIVARKFVCYD